ncbi:MAG TPA: hypothetical protein VGQ58_05865 [Candidatus Limnocylindrales bacterium]|nr:hypothetical protein [Candidatus Limnocylindrales bacterium]
MADARVLFEATAVSIQVVAYLQEGVLSGVVDSPEHLRDLLESSDRLQVTDATWTPLDGGAPSKPGESAIVIDDLALAAGDEEIPGPVHAALHTIRLEAGPYVIEGDLATLPGFDPGRALTRPTGTFVLLSDVRVTLLASPDAGAASHPRALVNRYSVDRVDSDLMLGFFFPGAHVEMPPPLPVPAAAGTPAAVPGEPPAPSPEPAAPGA